MPDRSFAAWLGQNWLRAIFMVLMFALVWFLFMMGVLASLHQSVALDRDSAEHAAINTEATRAAKEATATRKAVERLEKRLDVIGDGQW